jgi:hypothetical protein
MRLGEPLDAAGNRGSREPATEAQVLDLSLTCAGLGPSLVVSRLLPASRRSQGSLTPHVSGPIRLAEFPKVIMSCAHRVAKAGLR